MKVPTILVVLWLCKLTWREMTYRERNIIPDLPLLL